MLEMIIRSFAKAERENSRTIEKHRRIERKIRFSTRNNIVT